MTTTRPPAAPARTFLGRPRWFGTLFLVDVWERFSFYGMTAILYLYLVSPTGRGGAGVDAGTAAAVFGLYMAAMFLAALPGGWLADRVLGPRRATACGAVSIALGHYAMALPVPGSVVVGLVLVVAGTGLAKPAISWMVSRPDRGDAARREATFSLFYMSIQVSAVLAPLVTGLLGEQVGWHAGFGAAAVGMTFGVVQYLVGARAMGDLGVSPPDPVGRVELLRVLRRTGAVVGVLAVLLGVDVASGAFAPRHLLAALGLALLVVPVVTVRRMMRAPVMRATSRIRLRAFVWMMLASAVFWALFAQSGSVLNGYALDGVDRTVAGVVVPAGWFQAAHPMFVLLLSPVCAWLWTRLGDRAGAPVKFGAGLLAGGASWLVMWGAVVAAGSDGRSSPLWLLAAFVLQAVGELAIGPVGLALAARVAPDGMTNRYLGLFWVFAALGAGLGGQLANLAGGLGLARYFVVLAAVVLLAGGLVLLAARRLTSGLDGVVPGRSGTDVRTRGAGEPGVTTSERTTS